MSGIKHVVLLMLENASCDRYLGYLSESVYPYPKFEGIDPATTRSNLDWRGKERKQAPTNLKQMRLDPIHEQKAVLHQLSGDGANFVRDLEEAYPDDDPVTIDESLTNVMAYFPRGFLPSHHTLAENYRPCDAWHSSIPGPTWPNRFFALSGSSNGMVKMPVDGNFWGTCQMLFMEIQETILTRLSQAKKTFKVFYDDYPCSLILLRHLGHDILHNYSKMDEFYAAAKGKADDFPEFTFIEPKYYGGDQNDDHPPHNSMKAQKLVADVYNAIRSNDALWNSTLLVILHDEHGGFYDHVKPPTGAVPPIDPCSWAEYDFKQLGVRVPALLVSPYVKTGVEKTQFDHTSLLKYLKDKWSLGDLGRRVDAATSIAVALDENSPPRSDCIGTIRTPTPEELFTQYPDLENEVSPHHYAFDLFKKVAIHAFAVSALVDITKNHDRIDSFSKGWKVFKTEFWKVLTAFLIETALDYVGRYSDMVAAYNKKRIEGSLDALIAAAKVSHPTPPPAIVVK